MKFSFYKATGYASGLAVLAIAVAILVQVAARLVGYNLFGMVEIATYLMVAATFLALPYTLRTRGHIRILIFVGSLQGRSRISIEVLCHLLGVAFVAYFLWYSIDQTVDSFLRSSRSQGMLSAPLWVPQMVMSLGILLFAVALAHGLIDVLRGRVDLHQEDSEAL